MTLTHSKTLGLLAAWALTRTLAAAADFHISPAGNDANPGTAERPMASLAAARDAVRKSGKAGKEAITIHLADGTYYLPDTLVFGPGDSGAKNAPVTYLADHEGKAVVSGGVPLKLFWTPYKDGILKATTPPGLRIDQLFADGTRQILARYPNFDPAKHAEPYNGYAADAFSKERAARWADPAGGYIHAMHVHCWGGYHYLITGKKPDGSVSYEGGWQNNRQMGMHNQFRMVENIFEELDAPGEWFHDRKTGILYFYPPPGLDVSKALFEGVRLANLVEFRGTRETPVKFLQLRGITFRHAARTFMDNKEPLLRSDWTIHRGGAVFFTGAEDCGLADCMLDQVGANAVFSSNYNRRLLFRGLHVFACGASAFAFVGDPAAVRNPLFEYGQTNDLAKIDRTPGPKTDNYPADCTVDDCLIHRVGLVEKQGAGVQISMSQGITVRHCSIYETSRSGININEGTWGGHLIEFCDVFDTVLETSDHGSFNSWGRDRYWAGNHRGISQPAVQKDPQLPFLDAMKPIILRNSRWRCDHGWDIDLDDGSSNYIIYNNLLLAGGLKFREGYGRKAYNNILANGSFHPHVWFDDSGDEFTSNIVMAAYAPVGMPAVWGKTVDHNLFAGGAQDLAAHRQNGRDMHSIAGDAMFVDPAHGDFQVKAGSPAYQIGFRNFPMDGFGVLKPALRALARTPEFPVPGATRRAHPEKQSTAAPVIIYWLGVPIRPLQGEEYSAYGVGKDSGGLVLAEVMANGPAAKAGLRSNDLLVRINDKQVGSPSALFDALRQAAGKPLSVVIVRNQKPAQVMVTDYTWFGVSQAATTAALAAKPPSHDRAPLVFSLSEKSPNGDAAELGDGKLQQSYGPVFANRVSNGRYKADAGKPIPVGEARAWSFRQAPDRGRQLFTLFGSNAAEDPGWNTDDKSKFTPIATVDTTSLEADIWQVTSLRASGHDGLGTWRWLVWSLAPPNGMENTTFQELEILPGR